MKKKEKITTFVVLLFFSTILSAQSLPPVFDNDDVQVRETEIVQKYLSPVRIVWVSDTALVKNPECLLQANSGQAELSNKSYFRLFSDSVNCGSVILDFGKELQGGIQIVTGGTSGKVRVRFGESVGETMVDVGEFGATNNHAVRDQILYLPSHATFETNKSGFRFVRIDMVDLNSNLHIKEINAVFSYRDIPYLGSFRSNDERLNEIWMTGAYTVHLNMQDYLWDGIKRDRLVWLGDLHPEVMTVNTVFGYNDVVPKSLDFVRDITPLPSWMNGISSYSLWWIIIHRDWYYYHGDLAYLKEQKEYLSNLLLLFSEHIDENGKEDLNVGWRFLDWPSSENPEAIHAGLQSLMVLAFEAGLDIAKILDDKEIVKLCNAALKNLRKYTPEIPDSKQGVALLSIADIIDSKRANKDVLSQNGSHGMSTFYGYYMLEARAKAGDYIGAMDNIREYWGGMLDLGATTFWEDFDINWLENAARIDEITPEGKIDVHATYGDYCYVGYRHSFCHGWASGPTTWLSRHVLGIEPVEPGFKTVRIKPNLGNLEWVEGTFPTPHGVIKVKHTKGKNGKVVSEIDVPEGVKVLK